MNVDTYSPFYACLLVGIFVRDEYVRFLYVVIINLQGVIVEYLRLAGYV